MLKSKIIILIFFLFFLEKLVLSQANSVNMQGGSKVQELNQKIEVLEQKLTEDPKNIILWNNLGFYYSEKADWSNSLRCYKAALAIDDSYVPSNYALGNVFLKTGRADEAIFYYEKVIKKESNFWQGYYGLAMSYQFKNNISQAALNHEKVIKINSNVIDSFYFLAKCYEEMGLYKKAVRKYKEFVVLAAKTKKQYYLPFMEDAKKKVNFLRDKLQKL